MKYTILAKEAYGKWDDFVDNSPQGSIYSKSFYLESIGYPFSIGIVEENSKIIGGIVLARNQLRAYSNPLFVKYLGVLYADPEDLYSKKSRKKYKIDRMIIKHLPRFSVIHYSFHPEYINWLNFYWHGFSQTVNYTYQIVFSGDENFRNAYLEKVKGPLRTAKKHSLDIIDIDVDTLFSVIKKTYQARNTKTPFSKKSFISEINNLEKQNCFYYKGISDSDGNIHAVAGIVHDKNSANMIINGSDPLYRKYSGNTLVIDHMIEFASKNSKLFDFEGSMHQRIEQFYYGFGGELKPYYILSNNNLLSKIYHKTLSFIKLLYR